MANTGFLQATVAYKTAKPGGEPLDINGKPISETGLRQAIFLLNGAVNPNSALYQVEGFFNPKDYVTGNPTEQYAPDDCPTGIFYIRPTQVLLSPSGPGVMLTIYSSGGWEFVSGPAIATLSQNSGGNGFSYVEIKGNATEGQGFFIFKNPATQTTIQIYVVNAVDPSLWILEDGTWNMLGFWFDNGIWNY